MNARPTPFAAAVPDVIEEAFPHSRDDTRRALAAGAGVFEFDAGQTIIPQGDETYLALVLDGHVAFRRTTVDGRQLMLRIVTRGRLAPILPLVARPAAADAVALTPSAAARWRGEEFRSLVTADPGLALDILDHVLAIFEEVVERLDGLHYQDALGRVARMLHRYSDLFFAEEPVLTRAHLPIMVGTSREMTGRGLRILESRGLVERHGRDRLRLLDAAGLAAAAESGVPRPAITGGTSSSRQSPGDATVKHVARRDPQTLAGRDDRGR